MKPNKFVEKLYFAYGSNLHKEQMKMRCKDSKGIARAELLDYRLTFKGNTRGMGVADIVPSKGEIVHGALYKVSFEDLTVLNRYEGFPTLYNIIDIKVKLEDGSTVDAFAYKMGDQYTTRAPSKGYYETIYQGYLDWDLPIDSYTSYTLDVILKAQDRKSIDTTYNPF